MEKRVILTNYNSMKFYRDITTQELAIEIELDQKYQLTPSGVPYQEQSQQDSQEKSKHPLYLRLSLSHQNLDDLIQTLKTARKKIEE